MTFKSYIGSSLRRGTAESFTRISSLLIIITGVCCFITTIVIICVNIKDINLFEAAGLLTAISAYIALGVTGKYYGAKLEVSGNMPNYSSMYPGQYGAMGLPLTPDNQTNVEQFKTE
jgi:hypothetical protein